MLTQSDFEQRIIANISDASILERYTAQDPLVLQQVRSIASFLSLMSNEIDVATVEPFIKSRDRSIIADATNKGILPTATACQHFVSFANKGTNAVTISQGRVIEDNSGRPWRLLQSVTIAPNATESVRAEQSEYREVNYTATITEAFHNAEIALNDDLHLSNISVRDTATTPNNFVLTSRWMNVAPLEYAMTIHTDSLRRLFVQFGDSERAGRTVTVNDTFVFGITESYGYVDVSKLKDASLFDVLSSDEQKITVRFAENGIIRMGADPVSIAQMRVLASYPSLYDENAVFLGNFDYIIRKKFIARTDFISVWNENIQQRYYGVSWQDINHLHLAVVAKNSAEQSALESEISLVLGRLDNLFQDRMIVETVVEKPFEITIAGRLASVHDLDAVTAQIKGLLVDKYGKATLSASRWLVNGFNTQEMAQLLRDNIPAFQDRISNFTIYAPSGENKPHEWVYVTDASITVNLDRTADSTGASWIL